MTRQDEPSHTHLVPNITRPVPRLLGVYTLRTLSLCLLGPWFLVTLLPLYFKYKTLRFRFETSGVGVSWGLVWKRETYLAYSRIQDIHVSRGLFERWLGVATIHVQTASGNSAAEMTLPGLADHEAVRDYFYTRMRRAGTTTPRTSTSPNEGSAGTTPTSTSLSRDATLPLLEDILVEVRRFNERRGDSPKGPESSA